MAYAVPGLAVAVTAVSAGVTFAPPPGRSHGGYGWAVFSNVSPWVATVMGGANGAVTLQPYTADLIPIGGNQTLLVSMSIPPGGSATAPAGALTSIQVDWYVLGDGPPTGTWPLALTSQAVQAAIAGTVTFGETLLATETAATISVTVTPLPGTVALRILCSGSVGHSPAISGVTTGVTYGPVPTWNGEIFTCEIDSAADNQIYINWSTAPGATWYVVGITAPVVTTPFPPSLSGGTAPTFFDVVGGVNGAGQSAPLLVTNNGNLVPLVPTATASRLTTGVILAAPTSGGNYLFGFNTAGNVAGGSVVLLTDGGTLDVVVGFDSLGANTGSVMCPLFGYRTTTAVTMGVFGNALSQGNLLYAPGP
jgi:hypothetical protein